MAKLFRGQLTNPRIRFLELSNSNPARRLFEREFFDDHQVSISATGAAAIGGPAVAGAGAIVLPSIGGNGALQIGGPATAAAGSVALPAIGATGAIQIGGPVAAGVGAVRPAAISATAVLTLAGPAVAASGTAALAPTGPVQSRTAFPSQSRNSGTLNRASPNGGTLNRTRPNGGRIVAGGGT